MTELACEGDRPYRTAVVMDRGRFHRQQAFEDAIAFRKVRLAARCRACAATAPGARCDKHGRDLELIAEYRRAIERSNFVLGPAVAHREHPPPADEEQS